LDSTRISFTSYVGKKYGEIPPGLASRFFSHPRYREKLYNNEYHCRIWSKMEIIRNTKLEETLMAKSTDLEDEYEGELNDTFLSVLLLAGFVAVIWLIVFWLYLSRV
jgi:hypothetical protein